MERTHIHRNNKQTPHRKARATVRIRKLLNVTPQSARILSALVTITSLLFMLAAVVSVDFTNKKLSFSKLNPT